MLSHPHKTARRLTLARNNCFNRKGIKQSTFKDKEGIKQLHLDKIAAGIYLIKVSYHNETLFVSKFVINR